MSLVIYHLYKALKQLKKLYSTTKEEESYFLGIEDVLEHYISELQEKYDMKDKYIK